MNPIRFPGTLGVLCALFATGLPAQAAWWAPSDAATVGLELLRPTIRDDGSDVTTIRFATFTAFLSASGRIAGRLNVRVELPFAQIRGSDPGTGRLDGSTLGNPYVGVGIGRSNRGVSAELGARVPLTSDSASDAGWVGIYSDLMRYDAFLVDFTTITARARYRFHDPGGFTFEAGAGPLFVLGQPPPGEGPRGWQLRIHYHFAAGFESTTVRLIAGFAAWTSIRPAGGGFAERTADYLEATAALTAASVQPALHLILPVDNTYNRFIGAVLGLGVRYVRR